LQTKHGLILVCPGTGVQQQTAVFSISAVFSRHRLSRAAPERVGSKVRRCTFFVQAMLSCRLELTIQKSLERPSDPVLNDKSGSVIQSAWPPPLLPIIYLMEVAMTERIPAKIVETLDPRQPLRLTPAQLGGPIHTRSFTGLFRNLRLFGAGFLFLLFFGTAWLNWGDRQAVLWDLAERKFYIFGAT